MKVLATRLGRLVVLKPVEEITPLGGITTTNLRDVIVARYHFANATPPTTPLEEIDKNGFKFQLGTIRIGDTDYPVQEFTIYSDGLVAASTTTDTAEAFIQDITKWAKEAYGFRIDETFQNRKLFLSEVVVQFEKSINGLISKFSDISKTLSGLYQKTYGISQSMEAAALTFDFDRTVLPQGQNVATFRLERRIGEPFTENKLYSQSALRTQDHLALLETIEKLA